MYFRYFSQFFKEAKFFNLFVTVRVINQEANTEMYPGFQIWGSSEPLLEKFGGPLQSFGGSKLIFNENN